jgi:exopolyphosphatase / guanosine-5'-triphosphate,3'-diphosphate pyrophosphatase
MSVNNPAPLAAIDVGSNTVHLVVALVGPKGSLKVLDDRQEMVRLGADISALGYIGEERMARCILAVRTQAERTRELGASAVLGIATEGVRAAANGAVLIERVRAETGVTLHLVTGAQEAALTYWGATSGLRHSGGSRGVLDLGGGSLEIVVGQGTRILWRTSLPLGSGTIHDRYAPSDPASAEELAAARAAVGAVLVPLDPPRSDEHAVACGGTATTLALLAGQLRQGHRRARLAAARRALRATLSADELEQLMKLAQAVPAQEISARFGVDPARAPLLGAGSVVLHEAMRCLGTDALIISGRGVREGALLANARAGDGWLEAAARGVGW